MSAGIKANNDGSGAIQIGGSDYITISSAGAVAIPQTLAVTGAATAASLQVGGVGTNLYPLVSGTAVASMSGSSIDFTSIPSTAKRITVMFSGVSFSATPTAFTFIQLGTGATPTYTISGYGSSIVTCSASAASTSNQTTGFGVLNPGSSTVLYGGSFTVTNLSGNVWACTGSACDASAARVYLAAGTISLAAALTAVRFTAGADVFDAGSINIMWE